MKNYPQLAMRTNSTSTGKNPAVPPDLIHAVLGMADELCELHEAKDQNHRIEEIGDFAWFLVLAYHAVGHTPQFEDSPNPDKNSYVSYSNMLIGTLKLCGIVKKPYAYGAATPLPVEDILSTLDQILSAFCSNVQIQNTTLNEVLHRNIEKLKTRFPEKYTDEAANTRNLAKEALVLNKDPNA